VFRDVTDLALGDVFGVNGVGLRSDSYGMRWAPKAFV